MSDNELDELLSQLKETSKKHRHGSSNETNLQSLLKRIDVFINRRQMKLSSHQKRLDDLQRDLLVSESESSKNRVALQKKDFELHQLHDMLSRAEHTTQHMMTKYDEEVQKLSQQLCNVQHEYERLKILQKQNAENKPINQELIRLRERNQILEKENIVLRERNASLIQSSSNSSDFLLKISKLEQEIDVQKRRANEKELEFHRLEQQQSDEFVKLRQLFDQNEEQCQLLKFELQRVQAEKEILKVHLIEQKMMETNSTDLKTSFLRQIDGNDYEKFIRSELEINIDQANKLIAYWKEHQENLEEKIRHLTNELEKSIDMSHVNETLLHTKRDLNQLQIDLTDKNTTIYNLYKKIECLEQALTISKQRINAQLKEIHDLRSKPSNIPIELKSSHLDDEDQRRRSSQMKTNLRTSSPIQTANIQKHFHQFDNDSTSSMDIPCQIRKSFPSSHRTISFH